jgi:8-oxo-dGTP pyrophosphatase MutT (NUDIX family)
VQLLLKPGTLDDEAEGAMTSSNESVRMRVAIRAILITPSADVLLMRIQDPGRDECFWIAPGGGVEPGENVDAALRRELSEELGLTEFELGPLVWLRQHTFSWDGKRICQSERYHVVHVERFEPTMSDATEARWLQQFRWWQATELANAKERLTPLALPLIVSEYLAHGAPKGPLDLEVLVD